MHEYSIVNPLLTYSWGVFDPPLIHRWSMIDQSMMHRWSIANLSFVHSVPTYSAEKTVIRPEFLIETKVPGLILNLKSDVCMLFHPHSHSTTCSIFCLYVTQGILLLIHCWCILDPPLIHRWFIVDSDISCSHIFGSESFWSGIQTYNTTRSSFAIISLVRSNSKQKLKNPQKEAYFLFWSQDSYYELKKSRHLWLWSRIWKGVTICDRDNCHKMVKNLVWLVQILLIEK